MAKFSKRKDKGEITYLLKTDGKSRKILKGDEGIHYIFKEKGRFLPMFHPPDERETEFKRYCFRMYLLESMKYSQKYRSHTSKAYLHNTTFSKYLAQGKSVAFKA